jgi:4-amino-4-deoxy-L-arabinose transferase-like glycosyltransferase
MPLDWPLAIGALLTYAATHLIGLAQFPIYFFTDEAANGALAAEFLRNGFRDQFGQLFPLYFPNGPSLSLSTSVYLQVIPTWLFGQSVFITRAVPALITLTGALACGLILKHIFKLRGWWLGILLLSITPAWFLHSRTAFEHSVWVTFFAWFIYFYLRYRTDKPAHLITAIVFGALSFYSYSGGQLGLGVMGVLLALIDIRYHWQQRRVVWLSLAILIICALPYLQFQAAHPGESTLHLQLLDSYWLQDISLSEKIGRFAQEYLAGLRPDYWYLPDQSRDLIRHTLKGYGHELWITLPLLIAGLIIALKHLRQPADRTLLITLLVSPLGGTLAAATIQRDLVFVVPAALLTAIGLIAALDRLTRLVSSQRLTIMIGVGLMAGNIAMSIDALSNGPTWYRNYGLTGMQYGAPQVFEAIRTDLDRAPRQAVWLFPDWLNGSDMLRRYFTPDDPRVQLFDFDGFLQDKFDLTDDVELVMTQANYTHLIDSGKFDDIQTDRVIPLPDGAPGFYFVHARYSPEADAIFAAEHAALEQLSREGILLGGQTVWIDHTPLASGDIQNLFDHNSDTSILTRAINPAIIDITFPSPRRLSGLEVIAGSHAVDLRIQLFGDSATPSLQSSTTYTQLRSNQPIDVTFDLQLVRRLRVEIHDRNQSRSGSVTLRSLDLK